MARQISFQHGPVTYEVASAVTAGQLVIPNDDATPGGDATIKTATAGAVNVLGVALSDAAPIVDQSGHGADADPVIFSQHGPYVAVAYGVDLRVAYAAATKFGAKLKAGATGSVTPWLVASDDPSLVVGVCTEPGGVASAGTARARIGLF